MFIKFFKKIFTPTKQKDPHIEFYEDVPEPEIPVLKCAKHIRFKKSCPTCLQSKGYV